MHQGKLVFSQIMMHLLLRKSATKPNKIFENANKK